MNVLRAVAVRVDALLVSLNLKVEHFGLGNVGECSACVF